MSADPNVQALLEELRRRDPDEWPLPTFLLNAKGELVWANRRAREYLNLPADFTPTPFPAFCQPQSTCEQLLGQARKAECGDFSEGKEITLRTAANDSQHARIFCAPLKAIDTGEILGFYGFLVDKTKEHELREHLEALTLDVGQVLHATSDAAVATVRALRPTLEFLARQKNTHLSALLSDEGQVAYAWLQQDAQRLAKILQQLVDESEKDEYKRQALLSQQWDLLRAQITKFRNPAMADQKAIEVVKQPGFLRLAIATVRDTLRRAKPQHLPRERVRAVEHACDELELSTILAPLISTYHSLMLLERPLDALRDFVTTQVRPAEPAEDLDLAKVLTEAAQELREFANSRQIEIKISLNCTTARVRAPHRELRRALMNVIHNAIKYTRPRTRGRPSWVTVRLTCPPHCGSLYAPCAEIMVENWGTGIPEDEIEQGIIYKLGYRGRLATNITAKGTGIGLADTRHVLRRLGGEIVITSRPAADLYPKGDPRYYHQPFLTKVFIYLPTLT